jgi:hypothetical protein
VAVTSIALLHMFLKRSHGDICKRCKRQIQRGGGHSHQRTCVAVLAAEHYKRDLEDLYLHNEKYTTPIPTHTGDSTSSQTGLNHQLDLREVETAGGNEQENGLTNYHTKGFEYNISSNISTYLASLPGLDTAYMLQCLHWRPRPTSISNRARIALQFLSCTCAGDGLSRNHMKGILKFIKGLRGPDAAKLPGSIENCWVQVEEVNPPFATSTSLTHPQHDAINVTNK